MLGAIIGDIVGSVYEFHNYRGKDFQPLFHPNAFFTDDTVCTVAIAATLTEITDPSPTLRTWCQRYWSNGGWGGRFIDWIADDAMGPYGSYGNGAAMRVSPAGLLARSVEEAITLSNLVTKITHNHPEGMKGAAATAVAVHLARVGRAAIDIRQEITDLFGYDLTRSVDEIRPTYRYNETSQDTVPQALTCALEATDYEDAIRNAISIGGDSDTIAAIAGGVAESLFGIPDAIAAQGWHYLPQDMRAVMTGLYEVADQRWKHRKVPILTVVTGSIVHQPDCDGIVNSANATLRPGSGVSGAIHGAAGPDLEQCSQAYAPLALGQAVATPGFNLPNRIIVHVRAPKYLDDSEPQTILADAMANALCVADREKVQRLAVPAIAMGVYAFPPCEAVPILFEATHKLLPRLHHIREVRFVVSDSEIYKEFDLLDNRLHRDA